MLQAMRTLPPRLIGELLRGVIRAYQLLLAPVLPGSCRFHPSCSHYAREALASHGVVHGLRLSVWRILRCNPWNAGGFDPVPPATRGGHAGDDHGHSCVHEHLKTKSISQG